MNWCRPAASRAPTRSSRPTASRSPPSSAASAASRIDLGIIPDDLNATDRAIAKAESADILVTTGGASVGDHDFVREALEAAGVKIDFWKIAMRPGKPLMFGRKGSQRVLGLPGNPVSALVCARLFLKPLLDALLGLPPEPTPPLGPARHRHAGQ